MHTTLGARLSSPHLFAQSHATHSHLCKGSVLEEKKHASQTLLVLHTASTILQLFTSAVTTNRGTPLFHNSDYVTMFTPNFCVIIELVKDIDMNKNLGLLRCYVTNICLASTDTLRVNALLNVLCLEKYQESCLGLLSLGGAGGATIILLMSRKESKGMT